MSTRAMRVYAEYGQSIWYDHIHRAELRSGEFARLVASGVRGCTSNPTIFDKAIAGSGDYDEALAKLVRSGRSTEDVYYGLLVEDIQTAADALRPVYDGSDRSDGFISLEVRPEFSSSTQATVAEAHKLVKLVNRPNLMIKVPAVGGGYRAISELIGAGVSVNVTLIFSVAQYRQVVEAYFSGLEQALAQGRDVSGIASVASFFVSRLDTRVDELIGQRIERAGTSERERLERCQGKVALANAKRAYAAFREYCESPRFLSLERSGAHRQRVLWASTGTKNPKYPDTLYVDGLIGRHTVNTVPPQTLRMFQDHGVLSNAVETGWSEAEALLRELAELGIDLDRVLSELLEDGVRQFGESLDHLMRTLEERVRELLVQRAAPA